jgi:hypothetical protein
MYTSCNTDCRTHGVLWYAVPSLKCKVHLYICNAWLKAKNLHEDGLWVRNETERFFFFKVHSAPGRITWDSNRMRHSKRTADKKFWEELVVFFCSRKRGPHRKRRGNQCFCLRFDVITAVTMKNVVFWDVTPCGSCKNRRFGETFRLLLQGENNQPPFR